MTAPEDPAESDTPFRLSIHSSFDEIDPELDDDRTPWTMWTEGELHFADLPPEDQVRARRLLATSKEAMEVVTHLTGHEDEVPFIPGRRFSGVGEDWLLPRLRLDPVASPYDVSPNSGTGPLGVELNGEWLDIDDFWGTMDPSNQWHRICAADDRRFIGATAELLDDWLLDFWPEVRQTATWVGPHPDLHALALDWACAYVTEWAQMRADSTIEVSSEFLFENRLSDRSRLIAAAESAGRRPVLNGTPVDSSTKSVLKGDEDVVWFTGGEEFLGVTEEWLRPRLRLDPSVGSIDVESESLYVDLDGEILEDLRQEKVFGSGPNDGELARVETPGGGGGSCAIVGGWLEFSAPEILHTFEWIGLDADLNTVLDKWGMDCVLIWDEVEITWTREGLA